MTATLILSSHVATSDVGGSAQVVALARAGIQTVFVPTVLFGRHPGLGAPGGGAVDAAVFAGMLEGVAAAGVLTDLDAVITGYFTSAEQVAIAARTLDAARAASPGVRIIVDPIMGDYGKGLYVEETVAKALVVGLVSRADLLAPNAWELAWLTTRPVGDPPSALAAARLLGRPVLVSSVDVDGDIGVAYVDQDEAWLAVHRRAQDGAHGAGDVLIALFTGALVQGANKAEALETAVGQIARRFAGSGVRIERIA